MPVAPAGRRPQRWRRDEAGEPLKHLDAFPRNLSVFFGLEIRRNVTVSPQVRRTARSTMSDRVDARFSDGTPARHAQALGQGQIICST